ncbi:MAG: TIGR00725 family protein [Pseudomonadota bacterium]
MTNIPKIAKTLSGSILLDGDELNVREWGLNPSDLSGDLISPKEAFKHLHSLHPLRHLVVGIIGPREASESQMAAAERIGYHLGSLGITLICGGKSGVMTAVSKGCNEANGIMIGILPGNSPDDANEFVGIPLPTGLGEARNMVIAKSARVLIAVGGSYGTLSEVAYGLHFSKPVIGLESAPNVQGVIHVEDPEQAVHAALEALFFSASYPHSNGGCKFPYMPKR